MGTPCAGIEISRLGMPTHYMASYKVKAVDALSAFEVRFIIFDLWGEHVTTLSTTEVRDLDAGAEESFSASWRASPNVAERHYGSIAYVARVRTKAGIVIEADQAAVLREALKFSKKFKPEDLEPSDPAKLSGGIT